MNQQGIDYASVDGNAPPDFVKARAAGAEFAIIRKSYVQHDSKGKWHVTADKHYARDVAQARRVGLTVGSYGFFTFAKDGPSAADQVSVLTQGTGGVIPGKDLPYCVDVEFPGKGIVDTHRTQSEAFAYLLELISEVRRQAGCSPLIYTSHVQWHDSNGLGGPDSPVLDGCPLWIKTPYRLAARNHVDTASPRLPHVGQLTNDPHGYWRVPRPWERQGWWIHQYQGDALGFPGFSATVDVNHFMSVGVTSLNESARISWLQRRLAVLGEPLRGPLNVTGMWDADTEHAVRAFQTAQHLKVSGEVDIATFASLCW